MGMNWQNNVNFSIFRFDTLVKVYVMQLDIWRQIQNVCRWDIYCEAYALEPTFLGH